jgi:hypothetical protein
MYLDYAFFAEPTFYAIIFTAGGYTMLVSNKTRVGKTFDFLQNPFKKLVPVF